MTNISELPVEVHTEILKLVLHSSRLSDERPELLPSSRFPFNIALTCQLWRDILADIPECWYDIEFDVAADPSPILGVLEWSQNLQQITVLVFSSAKDHHEISKEREFQYVAAITDILKPHLHRCSSIRFDVMYEESLPSTLTFFAQPAPYLERLKLTFKMQRPEETCYDVPRFSTIPDPDLATSFPSLKEMSMDGGTFMELCSFDGADDWFENLKLDNSFSLRIERYRFAADHVGFISVRDFVFCISLMGSIYNGFDLDLDLRNLSVADVGGQKVDHYFDYIHNLNLADLIFVDVSKEFIFEFFDCTDCTAIKTTFKKCPIPRIRTSALKCSDLVLDTIIPDKELNADGELECSLRRVLDGWDRLEGGWETEPELKFISCSSFDDGLLKWLSGYAKYETTFLAAQVYHLGTYNCTNYSFEFFRELIDGERANICEFVELYDPTGTPDDPVLTLLGRHPKLSVKDIEWINSGHMYIRKPRLADVNGVVFEKINVQIELWKLDDFYFRTGPY